MSDEGEIQQTYSCGNNDEYLPFEQVIGPQGQSGYAIYHYKDDEVSFQPSFQDLEETKRYVPLDKPLWPLAKFPRDMYRTPSIIDMKAVFQEVGDFIHIHVELPHESLKDVLALWVMASYLPEQFDSIPYLCFLGPKDSGKTRALEVLAQLSFRGVLSPSCTSAALFRLIDKFHPTLLLDEAGIYTNEQKAEAIAVLNAGYRKGQFVLRVNKDLDGLDSFDCFGFKALASTRLFVRTIESRAIIVNMRKNVREIPLLMDKEKAANLRFILLTYRMNVLQGKEVILNDTEKILGYLPKRHGRIAELFYPLIAVAPSEGIREGIGKFAKDVYTRRLEEEKASTEAEIVEVLLACKDKVEGGRLTVQAITDRFNEGKPEKQQWKPTSIGRRLKQLGFSKTRVGHRGRSAIFYELKLLEYLARRYSLPVKTSDTSETSEGMERYVNVDTEVTEVSEGSTERVSLDDLVSVYWKGEASKKECAICGHLKRTGYEGVTTKRLTVPICEGCAFVFQKRREET